MITEQYSLSLVLLGCSQMNFFYASRITLQKDSSLLANGK